MDSIAQAVNVTGDGGTEAGGSGLGGAGASAGQQQAPPAAGFVNDDGTFREGWLERLPEGFEETKATLASFRDLPSMVKTLHHQRQMLGKKANAVAIPTEKSSPEEVAEFRKRMGVPETADGYKIKPEKLPEGIEWNDELARPYLEVAHKYHIPEAALRELAAADVQRESLRSQTMAAMAEKELQEGERVLRRTYGQDYERKIERAVQAARKVGLDPHSPGLRDPNVVKALVRLSELVSEDRALSGTSAIAMQTGRARVMDIINNKQNPYYERYWNGEQEVVSMVAEMMREG